MKTDEKAQLVRLGFLIDLYRRHPAAPAGWPPEIGIATAFLVLGVYAVLLPH